MTVLSEGYTYSYLNLFGGTVSRWSGEQVTFLVATFLIANNYGYLIYSNTASGSSSANKLCT